MTKRYLTHASAVVLAVVVLAGCSWRVEAPAPAWPSPDELTQVRDAAAERESLVVDATDESNAAGTPTGVVLNEIERHLAPTRLEALGGLYVAYPDATPTPAEDEQAPSLLEAVTGARDGHLADALATDSADLALLLASAGLSHALSAWYAAWVEDAIGAAELPVVAERTLPSEVLAEVAGLVPPATTLPTEKIAELAVMHDQARYAYEVMAARAAEDERDQWLARRDLQAARGEALVALSGLEDQREATYVVLGDRTADSAARVETARQIEAGAGATYASLLAEATTDEWSWLLHAAFDAYAQAATYGEPTAEDYPVPALPGITVS